MKSEKTELTANLTQLEIDNKKLQKELQRVEKERENVLSRKEMVTGENMQLIMEAEEFHQVKADLTNQLRSGQNRIRGTVNVTLSCIFFGHTCPQISNRRYFRVHPSPIQEDFTDFNNFVKKNSIIEKQNYIL